MTIKPNAKSYPLICLHSMYKRSTKNKKQHSWKQRQNLYSLYWTADSKVSIALCFSVLGRVPFSITSRILKPEPWALELGISVPQSGNYCPPRALPWQLLLSSDMDPVDHPAWQRCGLEKKAKWMASKWTEERMTMHRMHSDVRAKNAPNCQTTEDLKSC